MEASIESRVLETLPKSAKEAKQINEKYYFSGRFCKEDHISKRITKTGACYQCALNNAVKYKQRHRDRTRLHKKLYALRHPERKKAADKAWRENNKEHKKQKDAAYRISNWDYILERRRNSPIFNAKKSAENLLRKKKIKQAMPIWANEDLIEVQYIKAKFMEWFTGEKYHVDHVIPLQGKNVCGLHVENNLQVLPAKENLTKHNKFGDEQWGQLN